MKKQIIILTLLCLAIVSCEKKGPGEESEEKYEGSGLVERELEEGDNSRPYISTYSDNLRGIYVYATYATYEESSFYCSRTNKFYKSHEIEHGEDINFSISVNTLTIKDSCFINKLVITPATECEIEVPLKVNSEHTTLFEGRNYTEKYSQISNKTDLDKYFYENVDYWCDEKFVINKEDFKGVHYFFFMTGDYPNLRRGLVTIENIRTERIKWKNLNGEYIYFDISAIVEK